MTTAMKSVQATALTVLSVFWMIGSPAAAAGDSFDGSWRVSINTRSGTCQSGTLPIQVRDGKIVSGTSMVNASGQVGQTGALRVIVGDGVRKANGSGKLAGTSGSGTWSGGGGLCSGTWVAERN
jgi:hypothetical protein